MPNVESLESLLSADDSNAPATPQCEIERRAERQSHPDCLDETATSFNGSTCLIQDSVGDQGLDVIAI